MQEGHLSQSEIIIYREASTVWQALTTPEIIKQYFFGTQLDTSWQVGSAMKWTGEYEGQAYEDSGEVLSFEPEESLSYTYWTKWSGLECLPENHLKVTIVLTSEEAGTKITVTQSNYDVDKAEHSVQNWNMVLEGLKKVVES